MATKLALVQNGVKCVHVLRREGPPFSRWVFCFVLFCFFYLPLTFLRTGGNILGAAAAAAKSLQSCPTLCDPIDGSPSASPSLGFSRPRILEWVPISSSRGSSPSQGWNPGLLLCRQILHYLRESVSPQRSRVRWRYEP